MLERDARLENGCANSCSFEIASQDIRQWRSHSIKAVSTADTSFSPFGDPCSSRDSEPGARVTKQKPT